MNRLPVFFLVSAVLAMVSVPAYAEWAKITLQCSAAASNVLTGSATVTLCDANPCSGGTLACASVACDSSGATANQSTTISCKAPFKVYAEIWNLNFTDYEGSGAIIAPGPLSGFFAELPPKVGGQFGIVPVSGDVITLTNY